MARRQNILISTPLDETARLRALNSALARWPFLDPAHKFVSSADRLVINLPNLTENSFDDEENYDACLDQNYQVRNELPEWSKEFPDVTFAFIELDSFGSTSLYSGFVCRAGALLFETTSDTNNHILLLRHIGLETNGAFPRVL